MCLPKVTLMIPTYNQEQFIKEALESALAQDYENLEIIVSDDCSNDNTMQVIKKYKDPRLSYHRNNSNLGRVGNYHNIVHNLATGKWAVNLDGDDYYTSKSFISDALKTITKYNQNNIVAYCYKYANINSIKKFLPYTEIDENRIIISGKDYFLNYHRIGNFGHLNTIYRRDIGTSIKLYTLPYQASDFHSLMRLFLLGNIILDRRSVAVWRIHQNNTTINEIEDKQRQAKLTFDDLENFAKDYCSPSELKKWRKKANKAAFEDYLMTYVSFNHNFKAFRLLLSHPRFSRLYFRVWYYFLFRN